MKKYSIVLLIILLFVSQITAQSVRTAFQVLGAYYFPNHEGYDTGNYFLPIDYSVISKEFASSGIDTALDPGRNIGNGTGSAEAKIVLSHYRTYPLFQGVSSFTKDNNMLVKYSFELSPVSVKGITQLTLTPIAFFQLHTGISLGTGWAMVFNGLGRNLPGPENDSNQKEPFSGIVTRVWQAATFQFDLGVLYPGKWNHVVAVATGQFEYKGYTGAEKDEAWQYEGDSGQNYNGFLFIGSYFLGYRMPLILDTAGFLVETEQRIDNNKDRSKISDNGWGSDFIELTFGPLFNFKLNDSSSAAILIQMKNGIEYTSETAGYRFFAYREAKGSYVKFYRVAFVYTYSL